MNGAIKYFSSPALQCFSLAVEGEKMKIYYVVSFLSTASELSSPAPRPELPLVSCVQGNVMQCNAKSHPSSMICGVASSISIACCTTSPTTSLSTLVADKTRSNKAHHEAIMYYAVQRYRLSCPHARPCVRMNHKSHV